MQTIQEFIKWASALPPIAKGLVSLIVVAVAAFLIVALWSKPAQSTIIAADLWPAAKSMDGLRHTLDRLSRENAKFLVEVASADQYGLYLDEIAKRLNISRTEADTRSKQLQAQGLIEIFPLTDVNLRLDKDVKALLSPDPAIFLSSYLKQKPIGATVP